MTAKELFKKIEIVNEFAQAQYEKYYVNVNFDYESESMDNFAQYSKWLKDNYIKEIVKAATSSEMIEIEQGKHYIVKGSSILLDQVIPFQINLYVCVTNKF